MSWFEPVAEHLGRAYLRYSFTQGTEQEVEFLVEALGLGPGDRVLDVGCGPGRHAHALARRGMSVHGVDISDRFVAIATEDAPAGATFERADARALAFDGDFDAVISLCQGAFGLIDQGAGPVDPDGEVLAGMARAVRGGGRIALTAFSAYFQVRWLGEADTFDAERGVNHESTEVRSETGEVRPAELWTTCYTPRELRLMMATAGLEPQGIWSVRPGAYGRRPPDLEHEELLVIAAHSRW